MDVEIEFTRACSDEFKKEMRPKTEKVLQYYPEFDGDQLKVGRTTQTGVQGVTPQYGKGRDEENYIRLKQGASCFTISHELNHLLTEERVVDILAMARSPELIDRSPGYLDVQPSIKKNIEDYQEEIHELAVTARQRLADGEEVIMWFERELAKLADFNYEIASAED